MAAMASRESGNVAAGTGVSGMNPLEFAPMEDDEFISKTQRKKRMHDLQSVGAALTKLKAEQLARIEMPDELREAILEAKRFTKHEALRRQLQYIGRMMRNLDVGPIAAQLEALHAPSGRQTALFHRAEAWRDEIVADPGTIARFVEEFPGADAARLRTLATKAAAERAAERPPKHFRELFHEINAIVQGRKEPAP
jgi:ribosome-associated protein